jgi:hypothetical protein
VTALTLVMSSIYLALWLYVGSVAVNLAGAVLVAVLVLLPHLRKQAR